MYLHSTIFILIRKTYYIEKTGTSSFTFYYIYINTCGNLNNLCICSHLHSTIFILIHTQTGVTVEIEKFTFYYIYINTLILLDFATGLRQFTFYYIYINTQVAKDYMQEYNNLNSTIFILIQVL